MSIVLIVLFVLALSLATLSFARSPRTNTGATSMEELRLELAKRGSVFAAALVVVPFATEVFTDTELSAWRLAGGILWFADAGFSITLYRVGPFSGEVRSAFGPRQVWILSAIFGVLHAALFTSVFFGPTLLIQSLFVLTLLFGLGLSAWHFIRFLAASNPVRASH
jgi:hypothetical protein